MRATFMRGLMVSLLALAITAGFALSAPSAGKVNINGSPPNATLEVVDNGKVVVTINACCEHGMITMVYEIGIESTENNGVAAIATNTGPELGTDGAIYTINTANGLSAVDVNYFWMIAGTNVGNAAWRTNAGGMSLGTSSTTVEHSVNRANSAPLGASLYATWSPKACQRT